ncbi:MAG: NADP-dependent phosphogluconate dehydrogenase [Pseudomonadales bacterium]
MSELCDIGVIGMAVMGRNLALNIADHGFRVAVYNRSPGPLADAVAESGGRLVAADDLAAFIGMLKTPRRVLAMVRAGEAVDHVMDQLEPLLAQGDVFMDGGNSWYRDTERRERRFREAGFGFLGVGVSGGEAGARFGPSLMPGGSREAYLQVEPLFRAIAAQTESGPCVTYCGPGAAGHFVKMVHNGIEYADMQCIAEAYDVLRRVAGMQAPALASVFETWNRGPLESFLIEITARIFSVVDPVTGHALVDEVLDSAGQKGTGRWSVAVAVEQGIPVPSIAAAVDARVLSAMRAQRTEASGLLSGPGGPTGAGNAEQLVEQVQDALYAAKVAAYAQGMSLIAELSRHNGWHIDPGEIARIWKGGCIIRARLLDSIMRAYGNSGGPSNLLLDEPLRRAVEARQQAWRDVVCLAQQAGVPVPALSGGLSYYDGLRAAALPHNLTQAQRDAFGAHGYLRRDDPEGEPVHSGWLD